MARSKQPITFIVTGQDSAGTARDTLRGGATAPTAPTALPMGLGEGRVKHAVRLGTQRGGGAELRLQAVPGEDVVLLHLAQGPSLVLSPENARLLMLAQNGQTRPAPTPTAAANTAAATRGRRKPAQVTPASPDADAPDSVAVPMQLQWRGLEAAQAATRGASRGLGGRLGQVLLAGIDVVTGLAKDWLSDQAADFAAAKVVQHFDGQVKAGVYALGADTLPALKDQPLLTQVPAAADGGPLLVLIHGTFSDSAGTFGKLWGEHPGKVRTLFHQYAGRVYALDHPTLGVSPIHNALTLVQALPQGAQLHLLTHSRGGLVAEVLVRVCGQRGQLSEDELAFFAGGAQTPARQALLALAQLVSQRKIRVTRVVRVACPARGTLLASKRLDAYLSVLKWTMELAGLVITPALLNLLGEVARRRADPTELPGLAAMMPGSALVQWLHALDEPVPSALGGDLRVVAGDLQGDSVSSWLKTLLADSYYWCDNDLVVHTSSMYGGAPRAGQAAFVLDQGGKVSHFNYFSNERSAAAIVDALVQAELPQAFQPIGPLSAQGQSSTGVRGGPVDNTPAADKPAVFILPGILGSHLKKDGKRIWLGWRIVNGLKQLAYSGGPDGVEPDGPVGLSYDKLADYLGATHEVIRFGYDWRKPLEQEAQRLALAVDAALAARDASGQPVRLLAHSMGGVLARTLQLERPATWERLMSRPGGRLLMLGTPNGGSWAPMQVLSGDDSFGNTLVAFGAPFQDHSARMLMATFPGFLQLQTALLDDPRRLDLASTWAQLAQKDLQLVEQHNWWHSGEEQQGTYRWGVPPQAVLDQAVALRQRLDTQRDQVLPRYADRLLLVAGKDRFTPDGFQLTDDEGLVYLDAPEDGDGRVTLASARLPGMRTWQLDCSHGSLPSEKDAFPAYLELLQDGATQRLPQLPDLVTGTRGAASTPTHARVAHRPSRSLRLAGPPADLADAWLAPSGAEPAAPAAAAPTALRVEVLNSDLGFVGQPLLLGHYRALTLTGTEQVVNRLAGGAMLASLQAGLYPDGTGSHQIFLNTQCDPQNPWHLPRPEAVVVVGLGEEGKLTLAELSRTVRQGVIAWGQRVAEQQGLVAPQLQIAATLIGSGGSGISAGQAAQQVAIGVRDANERLRLAGWPVVGTLTLIELYLDRASEAWRALQDLAASAAGHFDVTATVLAGTGALRRPKDWGYRGTNHDLVSALPEADGQGGQRILYTLATRRARTELRAQATQAQLVSDLVESAASHDNGDTQLGRTLFTLLVPPALERELDQAQSLLLELASGTAGIPWELLDTRANADREARQAPWALRCKLLRKLRLDNFRVQVSDAHPSDAVLVVGEPQVDLSRYPALPGARAEAQAVAAALCGPERLAPEQVQLLTDSDAREVINTLFARDWRMVHIAGHGEPPLPGNPRGVVLSGAVFLGPNEIGSMRVVPELVFVNCCHLGARSSAELLQPPTNHATFAANVAEALMNIGVRCVIAAGWAVDDAPAALFATTFYAHILRGARFIDAVAAAREAAWAQGSQGNTWAAYQCYGDPDWVLRREGADAQQASTPLAEEFAGIASPPALTLALEALTTGVLYQGRDAATQRDKIRHLEARFAPLWGGMGAVAEAFGVAHAAALDPAAALRWFEQALAANDASASLKTVEQLGNLRVRMAWSEVQAARSAAAQRRGAETALPRIEAGLAQLRQLVQLQPTAERLSLCGSAHKRLAMTLRVLGHDHEAQVAVQGMQADYLRAFQQASSAPARHYAGLNLLAAELAGTGRLDPAHLAVVRQDLAEATRLQPDFWSVAGLTELRCLEAQAAGQLGAQVDALLAAFADLHGRVGASSLWASVHDNASFLLDRPGTGLNQRDALAAGQLLTTLSRYAQTGQG